tara:strand:+ start:855 stop:2336 length:1482 start_codon:yes stop_codon:yes gene_type:complete
MATTSLSLLQTGVVEHINMSTWMRFKSAIQGGMNNIGDMYLNDEQDYYGTDENSPIMIFDSSDFTGTTAAEVSSATLTLTIVKTHATNVAGSCTVRVWIPATDTEYTLPLADGRDMYDGSSESYDGVLRQGHGFVNSNQTSTGTASDYSYGGVTVHDLSSQDWSIGETLSFDITAQLKAYFRNPHRVNNGQVVITLDFEGWGGSMWGRTVSNSVHLDGENGSDPPTLDMTYETKSRTRVVLPTTSLGADFVWHGGNWKSDGTGSKTATVNSVSYELIEADRTYATSYDPAYETQGFAIFPIDSGEVTQGETLDAAILSFTEKGQTGYYGDDVPTYGSNKPAMIYGDKSDSPSYPIDFSDLDSKPVTTAMVYDKQGSNLDNWASNARSAYQLDVTDIVNEIIANSSWDGSAIQFILKPQAGSYMDYSSYRPFYRTGGAGDVFVPVLSFIRSSGGGGGGGSSSTTKKTFNLSIDGAMGKSFSLDGEDDLLSRMGF